MAERARDDSLARAFGAGAAKLPQQKELTGAIRIVTVANVDVCACCGTHVERCGQVGSIKLTSAQSYKGGTRVTMLCGMRAYEDHCIKFQNAEAVSGLLSAKINETAAAVQRLADENAALRAEKAALETRLFAADAAAFRGRKNALVFEPHLSPDSLRRLCTALMEQCTGVCAAFRARMPEATSMRWAAPEGQMCTLCVKR